MNIFKSKQWLLSSILMLSGTAFAGDTGWINSDRPGGSGDWENIDRFVKITCRIPGIGTFQGGATNLPAGYTCDKQRGGWCINNQVPNGRCKNMQVRYTWTLTGQQTQFFDSDRPGGSGDWENIDRYMKLQCRFGNQTYTPDSTNIPAGFTCDKQRGGWCINNQTHPSKTCRNNPVTVRFTW